jgi:tRNA-binding protein
VSEAPIEFADFLKVELRVGTVIEVEDFPEARKPAFKLKVDFGPAIGVRQSSAQVTALYSRDELLGRQVLAVLNFEPKRIAGFRSEILVCGFVQQDGSVVLVGPDRKVENGLRLA